jgi:cell division protein FtsA
MTANLIVGLAIGTTKTCAVIGELSGDPAEALRARSLKIRGVGQARTSGVRGDTVTSLDAATEGIKQAVREAELMAGATVDRVFAGIAGEHIQARSSMGVVAVAGEEITSSDVDRVHEVARAVPLGPDRELLHAIPNDYCVDYQGGIKRALGLTAMRLETEVFVITTASSAAANIRKAVSKAGYGVQELVLEPLAAARAVLSEDEKEVGVAMIEIGGGTTDLAVFQDGRLRHVQVVPLGGDAVTGDLVKVLGVPWTEAQKLKEQHAHAIASQVGLEEVVEAQGPTPSPVPRLVSRELVARIAEHRMEETLLLMKDELVQQDLLWRLGAGIVLTGGGAALPGMIDLAQRVFPMPVRLGVPGEGLSGLAASVGRPRFATAVGLALHGVERFGETGQGATTLTSGVVSKMGAWLKEFF